MRSRIGGRVLLSVAALVATPSPGAGVVSEPAPNFVLVLIDDLGWSDLPLAGNPDHRTPTLDRLAAEGVLFRNAYANAPNCSPSRASLLTGQYPPRTGIVTVGSPGRGRLGHQASVVPHGNRRRLDPSTVGLAQALGVAGYRTAAIGKWHLRPAATPERLGFDHVVERKTLGYDADSHVRRVEDAQDAQDAQGETLEYLDDRLTDEALRFIDEHRADPFFLYLAHYSVHGPLEAKPELVQKYEAEPKIGGNPIYAAMIESVDLNIGRIVRRLGELDLTDRTVVIVTSDNGSALRSPSSARGVKGMLYEGGIRVPLIVKAHGRAAAGSVVERPVLGIDLYPTVLELAGLARPEGHVVDGVSLVPLLRGADGLDRPAIYWHVPAYTRHSAPAGAIRRGNWKLVERLDDGSLELYDLAADPFETQNRFDQAGELGRELHAWLREWRASLGARIPAPPAPSASGI